MPTGWGVLRNHSSGSYYIEGKQITYDLALTFNSQKQPIIAKERYAILGRWDERIGDELEVHDRGQFELILERLRQETQDSVVADFVSDTPFPIRMSQLFGIEPVDGIIAYDRGYDINFPISFEVAIRPGAVLPPNVTMVESHVFRGFWRKYILPFCHAGVYDFMPGVIKHAGFTKGMAELEEDGSNLALVLQRLLRDEKKRNQLYSLLSVLIGGIEEADVVDQPDKSLLLAIREKYDSAKRYHSPTYRKALWKF